MFDEDMHKEYLFLSYLIGLLPEEKEEPVDLDGKLKLEYYKLQKTFEGAITLEKVDGQYVPSKKQGVQGNRQKSTLDEILDKINENYDGMKRQGRVFMWLDNASDIDILFYEPYARIIADIAKNEQYNPLTVGVFGLWGAGKSTLLKLIGEKLKSQDGII